MCDDNRHPANFLQHMAPTNLQGTGLQTTDSAATAIRLRRKDEARERETPNVGYGHTFPSDRDWFQEHRVIELQEHKQYRGGATMRAAHGLLNAPRNHFPETVRDTGPAAEARRLRDEHNG
jgi:hypothetical protein